MRIGFGPFAFDRHDRLLWRDGVELALPPRVLGVLELLVNRAGQIVARQDLLDGVWKDAFVTDTSLAEAVSYLRQTLGDDPQSPRYIQTVHRRGYRFIAPIAIITAQQSGQLGYSTISTPPSGSQLFGDSPITTSQLGSMPVADSHLTRVRAGPDTGQGGARAGSEHAQSGVRVGPDPGQAPVWVRPDTAMVPGVADSDHERVEELSKWWELSPLLVVLLCIALGTIGAWRVSKATPELPAVARFEIALPPGTSFDTRGPAIAVSADGRTIAWSGCDDESGTCALYTRAVDRLEAAKVAATEGASHPFFAPDGRWVGFFADGKLKKIAAAGGATSILADAPAPGGAAWGADGRIAFAGTAAGGLTLVSGDGGSTTALPAPRADRGELRHLAPSWLPSGGLLFTIASSPEPNAPGELAAIAPQGREWTTVRGGVTRSALAAPGYLLLSNGADLQAATFDTRTLKLTSGADSVLTSIGNTGGGVAHFAIGGGTLAAVATSDAERATWSDGADAGPLARLSSIAISPDGHRAAGVIVEGSGSDVWIADLPSGALTRMTYGGTNVSPAWSHDGTRLFFATRSSGPFTIAVRRVDDRTITAVPSNAPTHLFPASAAPDGRLAVTTVAGGGHTAVAILPAGGTVQLLPSGPFDEASPAFSPDGRWLALESSESGSVEIVVRDPNGEARATISSGGGARPRWSADGRTIYFESGGRVMRAAFDPDKGTAHTPEPAAAGARRVLAIAPSGRILSVARTEAPARALIVLQWLRELRERLPLPVAAPR